MIIKGDNKHVDASAYDDALAAQQQTALADAPPPYPDAGPANLPLPIPGIPPSNFVHISRRDGSIRGTYVIDTSLSIPEDLLSAPQDAQARGKVIGDISGESDIRPNLKLETKDGSINANVWLVPHTESQDARVGNSIENERASIDAFTKDGSITVKLVRCASSTLLFLESYL